MAVAPSTWSFIVPFVYAAAALFVLARPPLTRAWAVAHAAALGALGAALAASGHAAWAAFEQGRTVDSLGLTFALLVALLGWIIVRYSWRYLEGEPGQARYLGALLLTLGAVSIIALTDHLGVLLLAWITTSLGLDRLLTFYPDRPGALLAAHKKFLASRVAEVCMAIALLLIWWDAGTLAIVDVALYAQSFEKLPIGLYGAALLVTAAVIFKSAQIPVHGWLIQVMEAPTPVSALLHAGIVNLGGFVLIRLSALLSAAPAAQTLAVVVGSVSAVLAALVMMTRISIKVRLAWSTCAQMGFMLMECGLGLYDLALLHLVAHSLYKAHCFLTAGEAVLDTRRAALLPDTAASGAWARLAAAPAALLLVVSSGAAWQALESGAAVPAAAFVILAFGTAPLLWRTDGSIGGVMRAAGAVLAVANLYFVWHGAFNTIVDAPPSSASVIATAWVTACFGTLYIVQVWITAHPAGRLSTCLYPWAYSGFHLDERFTRLTFRLWPMRRPARTPAHPVTVLESGESA